MQLVKIIKPENEKKYTKHTKYTYEDLRNAIEAENLEMVKDIITQHPKFIFQKDAFGATVFHSAALIKDPEIVRFILRQKPSKVNVEDEEGLTPLHLTPYPEIAKIFIDYGARIDIRDKQGNTPLHTHAIHQLPDVIEILLKNGANLSKKNHLGQTALEISKSKNDEDSLRIFEEYSKGMGAGVVSITTREVGEETGYTHQFSQLIGKVKKRYGFKTRTSKVDTLLEILWIFWFLWFIFNVWVFVQLLLNDTLLWRLSGINPKNYVILDHGPLFEVIVSVLGGMDLLVFFGIGYMLEYWNNISKKLIRGIGVVITYILMYLLLIYSNQFIGITKVGIEVGTVTPKEVRHYPWEQVERVKVGFYTLDSGSAYLNYTFEFSDLNSVNFRGLEVQREKFEEVIGFIKKYKIFVDIKPGAEKAYQMVLDGKEISKKVLEDDESVRKQPEAPAVREVDQ